MLAVLNDGKKELIQNLRDCFFLIEQYLGRDICDFIQEEFDYIETDNETRKKGLNDIKNEFNKVMELKGTFSEEQQELLEDLETEIDNNIWE